jgi:hypothetical protein
MKRLMVSGLALLLTTGGGAVLADHDHGDYYHGGRGHGYRYGYYQPHWYPRPYYREVYFYPSHDYHHHDNDYYYPLGAALIGAAVTYSIVHTHDTSYSTTSSSSVEVVGCHRIERYPDGSERRVEVPLEECR